MEQEDTVNLTDTDTTERVARGATLLDERVPGWRSLVKPADLRMTDGSTCIVGQLSLAGAWERYLYGPYTSGLEALGLTDQEAHQHGFVTYYDGTEEMDYDGTAALTEHWIKVINNPA
jgi:hypothetical protein